MHINNFQWRHYLMAPKITAWVERLLWQTCFFFLAIIKEEDEEEEEETAFAQFERGVSRFLRQHNFISIALKKTQLMNNS